MKIKRQGRKAKKRGRGEENKSVSGSNTSVRTLRRTFMLDVPCSGLSEERPSFVGL